MKKIVHGSLHQATGLVLNALSNKHILEEIASNTELETFLSEFTTFIVSSKEVPNAKAFNGFVKQWKNSGRNLPIPKKALKTKTVLYLRACQTILKESLNKV